MKKKSLLLLLVFISTYAISQSKTETTNSSKEYNLLSLTGGMAAMLTYNTYGYIGAISDGFVKNYYDSSLTNTVMTEQINFCKIIGDMLDKAINEKAFTDTNDISTMQEVKNILIGLSKQAQFAKTYTIARSESASINFDEQRKANWEQIKKLLNLKD